MPVLENPKHELFAQELAKGLSQAEAYAVAGYRPSEPHASRLASNGKVPARVAELQAAVAEKVVEETGIDRAVVLRELGKIVLAPLGDEIVRTADKRAACVDYAKIEGWVTERHEFTGRDGGPIETKDVSAREIIERRIAGLSARSGESEHSGKPH